MSELNGKVQSLDVVSMPLKGTHLIEASAGTGKTFNITRLYLRLLLESELSVTQILVMTFTNAATEELRGRLSETLQFALQYWQSDVFREANFDANIDQIYQQFSCQIAENRIALAIVEMDEAAIFTLHGFCHRILKQMAFNTGSGLVLSLENDQRNSLLQATQDWYRQLRLQPEKLSALAVKNWHTPEQFINEFSSIVFASEDPRVIDTATIESDFQTSINILRERFSIELAGHLSILKSAESTIANGLIDNQKTGEQQNRQLEWQALLTWLGSEHIEQVPVEVGKFLNGNRYRNKEDIKDILKPIADTRKDIVKEFKSLVTKTEEKRLEKGAFDIVAEGVSIIKAQLAQDKQDRGAVGFDDLIELLAKAVRNSSSLAEDLKNAFPAALIDEFQDTDAKQFDILERVYMPESEALRNTDSNASLLVMIGDPKQAIYGFRGGDIFTYLKARDRAQYCWIMDTNWRSTHAMVSAYNRLFWGQQTDLASGQVFGSDIGYELINSTPKAAAAQRPMKDPLDSIQRNAITYVTSDTGVQDELSPSQLRSQTQAQLAIWCVDEIRRLLNQVTLNGEAAKPADIAILVRNSNEAGFIQRYLKGADLTSVYLSDKTPLFESVEASQLLTTLSGIWRCENDSELVRALASPLLGVNPTDLLELQADSMSPKWSELRARVYGYKQQWLKQGVMPLLVELIKFHYQPGQNAERALTNILHLTELLEQSSRQYEHPIQTIQWLKQQIENQQFDEQFEQRLESDAALIKIVTQHKSKGLEYPFVFVPFANEYRDPAVFKRSLRKVVRAYDPIIEKQQWHLGASLRTLDLLREQEHAEAMRLLYVAITRAEYRCYLGVGEFENSSHSALGRAIGLDTDAEQSWYQKLTELAAEPNSYVSVVNAQDLARVTTNDEQPESVPELDIQESRLLTPNKWRVHSFSGLSQQQSHSNLTDRDQETELQTDTSPTTLIKSFDARFTFPKGATPGNFLHDVFELSDFNQEDWQPICRQINDKYKVITDDQVEQVSAWFKSAVNASLTGDFGVGTSNASFSMRELSRDQTLREAEFYFPIQHLEQNELLQQLLVHRQALCKIGLLEEYMISPIAYLNQSTIRGMMHGFIDLIFERDGKFYIADYKSTYLGDHYENYSAKQLAANNLKHSYDLQYLIYAVALHRYLRKKLPNYEPSIHFGGVYYLYVRGMSEDAPSGSGVFYTYLDSKFLLQLDALFGGTGSSASQVEIHQGVEQ